jgi:dTDP-4-amino-4,6-dideoxygalactose transaminase
VSHLFGFPQDIHKIEELAKKYNLKIIEDCSHAHGAMYRGRKVGALGDVAFFSLQGDKAVAGGEGGVVTTNNKNIFDRMRLYAHMGRDLSDIAMENNEYFLRIGYGRKGRMHPVSATLAAVDLDMLDETNQRLNSKIEEIYSALASFSNMKTIDRPKQSSLGGFHYGLPIWLKGNNVSDLKQRLFRSKNMVFREYPYVQYHKYPFFSDSQMFHEVIHENSSVIGNEEATIPSLKTVEVAVQALVFLDIKSVDNFNRASSEELALILSDNGPA